MKTNLSRQTMEPKRIEMYENMGSSLLEHGLSA